MKTFKQQIDAEMKQVRKLVRQATVEIAKDAYDKIVEVSPVWTGAYIASHRIGIGVPNQMPAEPRISMAGSGRLPPRLNTPQRVALRETVQGWASILKQSSLKGHTSVIIHNNSEHAMLVETMLDSVTGSPPVYGTGKLHAEANAKNSILKAEAKVRIK